MKKIIENFFKCEKIEYYASLPLSECKIIKPHLLPEKVNFALVFLMPYYSETKEQNNSLNNISLYAKSRDYHLYFDGVKNRLSDILSHNSINQKLYFFCDHSPIDEVNAAAKCGLGIIGNNKLLINEKYKSFVFIGEILSEIPLWENTVNHIEGCMQCGNCQKQCDYLGGKSDYCLSKLTQTKNLSPEQLGLLKNHPLIWGCDNCQLTCPMCENPTVTPIDFFKQNIISYLDSDTLEKMPENEFSLRAFSWKGKHTLQRNLDLKK